MSNVIKFKLDKYSVYSFVLKDGKVCTGVFIDSSGKYLKIIVDDEDKFLKTSDIYFFSFVYKSNECDYL